MINEAFYKRMKAFSAFYYCIYDSIHPREILSLDNNLELAFYLKDGKTKKDLRNIGVDFKQSQITLLKSFNLIYEKKGRYFSNVLFFPEYETKLLRDFADDFAVRIAATFSNEIKTLTKALIKKGCKNSIYSILFSYVLDGLVWENLMARGQLEPLKLDKDNPVWNGLVWLVEPKRSETLGTFCSQSGNVTVCYTTSSLYPRLVPDVDLLSQIANEYRAHGRIVSKDMVMKLSKEGLYSENEGFLCPVINCDIKDPVFRIAKLMSACVANYLSDHLGVSSELPFPPGLDEWKKLVIIYHKIMWSTIGILVNAGEVCRPDAFCHNENTCLRDILYLVIR